MVEANSIIKCRSSNMRNPDLGIDNSLQTDHQWPRISIVTPSFNQAQYLEETIRSVLQQGYPNLEYIIIDGGSTDGSVEIIKKYESQLTYWESNRDKGQTYAITKGMQYASGDLVNWLNSDDILLPGALEMLGRFYLSLNRDLAVICGHNKLINETGKEINRRYSKKIAKENKTLPQSPDIEAGAQASVFLTRKSWELVNGINVNLNFTMDTDLYFRIFASGVSFYILDYLLSGVRLHNLTKTHNGWEESINYKRNFYLRHLQELDKQDRQIYRPRIERLFFGFYAQSIWPSDPFSIRLKKLIGAIRTYPHCLLEPYRVRRLVKLLCKNNH